MCPYCGKEMEDGYLQSSRFIVWSSIKLSGCILPQEKGDFKASGGIVRQLLPSHYCRLCNILISRPLTKKEETNSPSLL
jgi:hypothetical protein